MARVPLKSVRWGLVWKAAQWLVQQGRERLDKNLTDKERREFRDLMVKSKGRPAKLTDRQRDRVRSLVKKALTGEA
jgi:hypothetical protein